MSKEKEERKICPYLETSHSKAILYYSCQAVEANGLRIKPGSIARYSCFKPEYSSCKNYRGVQKRGKCKKK